MGVLKFVTHSRMVLGIARRFGWLPGARYTNLRDVREFDLLGFLDIDWQDYSFKRHIQAAKQTRPLITVARDVNRAQDLNEILDEAYALLEFAKVVVLVPKDPMLANQLTQSIPPCFFLGYSVPTKYGQTSIDPKHFGDRPVHLLGGRPDVQRKLADRMNVYSFDCNRFTLDACYGDYFDGDKFRPHPTGGYLRCIRDSLRNVNVLWRDYT